MRLENVIVLFFLQSFFSSLRGILIEELAEKSTFLETSYLLIYGQLPTAEQLNYFSDRVMKHTFIHEVSFCSK